MAQRRTARTEWERDAEMSEGKSRARTQDAQGKIPPSVCAGSPLSRNEGSAKQRGTKLMPNARNLCDNAFQIFASA